MTDESEEDEESSEEEEEGDSKLRKETKGLSEADKREVYRLTDLRKKFLLRKIMKTDLGGGKGKIRGSMFQTELDDDSAELISRYLASKREFLRSFNTYLRQVSSAIICAECFAFLFHTNDLSLTTYTFPSFSRADTARSCGERHRCPNESHEVFGYDSGG